MTDKPAEKAVRSPWTDGAWIMRYGDIEGAWVWRDGVNDSWHHTVAGLEPADMIVEARPTPQEPT